MVLVFAAGALAAMLLLGIQACGGDGEVTVATTTVVQTVTSTKTARTGNGGVRTATEAGPNEAGNIRNIDWKTVVGARPMARDVENVIYADFTGDGGEEALVLVRMEGSGAYLDYYIYTLRGSEMINLFEKLEVSHGKAVLGALPGSFVETTAIYGPDDPNCCPSNLMHTTYQWSRSAELFTAVSVEMAPNPQVSAGWAAA